MEVLNTSFQGIKYTLNQLNQYDEEYNELTIKEGLKEEFFLCILEEIEKEKLCKSLELLSNYLTSDIQIKNSLFEKREEIKKTTNLLFFDNNFHETIIHYYFSFSKVIIQIADYDEKENPIILVSIENSENKKVLEYEFTEVNEIETFLYFGLVYLSQF